MATEFVKSDQLNASFQGMTRLPWVRQLGLLVVLAASIALGVYMALWLRSPDYSVLYRQASVRDASAIVNVLLQQNIAFKVDTDSGLILVDSKRVNEARMALAVKDLQHSAGDGFDPIEKDQGFSTSDLIQNTRYQRALEGELERTIMAISAVDNARVHLALPKESALLTDKRKPSASVFINLAPRRHLGNEQVAAIIHLVASSVPDMNSNAVTLVDNKGHLLSRTDDNSGIGLSTRQLEYKHIVESQLASNIVNILMPIVGPNKVRAQVVASMDFTQLEMSRESFDPASQAVRNEQRVEQHDLGVVGPDAIKRLSVAVVVDHKMTRNEKGVLVSTAYTQEELKRFTKLAKEAVGFDAMRGDTVNVINAEFASLPAIGPASVTSFFDKPWIWNVGKLVLGGLLVALVSFAVLRLIMRFLANVPAHKQTTRAAGGDGLDEGEVTLRSEDGQRIPKPNEYESYLEMAKAMAIQEPRRVAQVVKHWVNEG